MKDLGDKRVDVSSHTQRKMKVISIKKK